MAVHNTGCPGKAEELCQFITPWLKWSKRWTVCLLKWSILSTCSSHGLRKAPFWVREWGAFAWMHYEPDKKEPEGRWSLLRYEEPHSANPSLLFRCHYRLRARYQNKDPVQQWDKNIQFLSCNIFRADIKNKTISNLAWAAFAIVLCIIQKP